MQQFHGLLEDVAVKEVRMAVILINADSCSLMDMHTNSSCAQCMLLNNVVNLLIVDPGTKRPLSNRFQGQCSKIWRCFSDT